MCTNASNTLVAVAKDINILIAIYIISNNLRDRTISLTFLYWYVNTGGSLLDEYVSENCNCWVCYVKLYKLYRDCINHMPGFFFLFLDSMLTLSNRLLVDSRMNGLLYTLYLIVICMHACFQFCTVMYITLFHYIYSIWQVLACSCDKMLLHEVCLLACVPKKHTHLHNNVTRGKLSNVLYAYRFNVCFIVSVHHCVVNEVILWNKVTNYE